MSTPAPPIAALRRIARPAPALHGPARAFTAPAPSAGAWNQELPGTGIEVIFELSGGWDLELGRTRHSVRSFAAGLVVAPVRTRAVGATDLVQLTVDPLAVPALFGVPAGELRGTIVELDQLLGRDAHRALDHLASLTGVERARVGDAWARGRLAAARAARPAALDVPPDVLRATALLRASGGSLRVDDLATELGCTRRHLARRFAIWLGVSPSEYRRLVRFERATGALRADPSRPLGTLAVDAGFADHAHMDREFRVLAGASPRAVAARL